MRACISPVDIHAEETLNISKYVDRVHNDLNESLANRDLTLNEIQKNTPEARVLAGRSLHSCGKDLIW